MRALPAILLATTALSVGLARAQSPDSIVRTVFGCVDTRTGARVMCAAQSATDSAIGDISAMVLATAGIDALKSSVSQQAGQIAVNTGHILAETNRAQAQEALLAPLGGNVAFATVVGDGSALSVAANMTAQQLVAQVSNQQTAGQAEVSRAQTAEQANTTAIGSEASRAKAAEGLAAPATALTSEVNRATAAEAAVQAASVALTDPRIVTKLPAYQGEVLTGIMEPTQFASANTQLMTRWPGYARQTLNGSIRIVLPNYWVKAGSGEQDIPGTTTVTASFEYPAGVYHQAKFNGSVTGSVASGTRLIVSDPIAVNVPNNALVWIDFWWSNPNGIPYMIWNNGARADQSQMSFGATVADQTMGGTVAQSSPIIGLSPAAVIGPTTQPAICMAGTDSRVFGWNDTHSDPSNDGGDIARRIGAQFAYINMGIPQDTLQASLAPGAFTARKQLTGYCSVNILEGGVNDANLGKTATQIASLRSQVAALILPVPSYGTTLYTETTSTDSWGTYQNQTPVSFWPTLVSFNGLERAGLSNEVGDIDLAHMIDPGDTGRYPSNGAPNGYLNDGIHGSTALEVMIARSAEWSTFNPWVN